NLSYGVFLASSTSGNVVRNNLIGVSADGVSPLQGGAGQIRPGIGVASSNNQVTDNRIAFNNGAGVEVTFGTGNLIQANAIFRNAGLGIDVGPNGVTPNDAGDADTGANNLQNFPVLSSVTPTGTGIAVDGTLNSRPNQTYHLDFTPARASTRPATAKGRSS